MIGVQDGDRLAMSQRERDVLAVMRGVLTGERTAAEAARLLRRSVRQIRRLKKKLKAQGDQALVHGLRGRPSNHRHEPTVRRKVLAAYRRRYRDSGPTLASEKLAEDGLVVGVETLRRWLLAEGLWERKRRRDPHRSRRPRRSCFGELVQMDASIHDWLEGRGEVLVLITMIDDATGKLLAKFYRGGTVEAHLGLLGEWLRKYGRPRAVYTDRHSIFEVQDKGRAVPDPDARTQFGRALAELDVERIRAHSPQAKGRVERSFGTAQDRWVKELRLAKAKTCEEANAVLAQVVPAHNRRFAKAPERPTDGHRRLGPGHRLEAILSIQTGRVVSNDYVVRLANRHYQLLPPVYPGERGGRVILEERLDGTLAIRFGQRYLPYQELTAGTPKKPSEPAATKAVPAKTQPSTSGAEPPYRPAKNHPWRKSYK
jgi:hypothetical protein